MGSGVEALALAAGATTMVFIRRPQRWRMLVGMSGGLVLATRLTQVSPVDVGPEFFATNGPLRCFFNGRAAICRDSTFSFGPLVNQHRRNANGGGQSALR